MSTLSTTNLKNPSSGSNNIVLAADGSTTITTLTGTTITGTSVRGGITSGTVVASTSGTSIDFTSIPSYVKRITVMFSGVSHNGGSTIQLQIGDSGGIETTDYVSGNAYGAITSGFLISFNPAGAYLHDGSHVLTNLSGNTWVQNGCVIVTGIAIVPSAGSKTLSATLDRIRITTVNGTDTFDAGSINILYEG